MGYWCWIWIYALWESTHWKSILWVQFNESSLKNPIQWIQFKESKSMNSIQWIQLKQCHPVKKHCGANLHSSRHSGPGPHEKILDPSLSLQTEPASCLRHIPHHHRTNQEQRLFFVSFVSFLLGVTRRPTRIIDPLPPASPPTLIWKMSERHNSVRLWFA